MAFLIRNEHPHNGMQFDAIRWDVVFQGIYCTTITAPSNDEALLMAMHFLGVDSLCAVEVFEVTQSQPGQPAQI